MQDLVYTTDWLSDSTVFKVNTIDPHSDHHYYRNEAELKQHASSFVQSLNGNWKVSYVKDSNLRARDFYKQGFNESGFDSVKVPDTLSFKDLENLNTSILNIRGTEANFFVPIPSHKIIMPLPLISGILPLMKA